MDNPVGLGVIFTALTGAVSLLFRELLKAEREKCDIWRDLYGKEKSEKDAQRATIDRLTDTTGELSSTLKDVSSSVRLIYEDMLLDHNQAPPKPAARTTRSGR